MHTKSTMHTALCTLQALRIASFVALHDMARQTIHIGWTTMYNLHIMGGSRLLWQQGGGGG